MGRFKPGDWARVVANGLSSPVALRRQEGRPGEVIHLQIGASAVIGRDDERCACCVEAAFDGGVGLVTISEKYLERWVEP